MQDHGGCTSGRLDVPLGHDARARVVQLPRLNIITITMRETQMSLVTLL